MCEPALLHPNALAVQPWTPQDPPGAQLVAGPGTPAGLGPGHRGSLACEGMKGGPAGGEWSAEVCTSMVCCMVWCGVWWLGLGEIMCQLPKCIESFRVTCFLM